MADYTVNNDRNPEINDLGTQANGATQMHKTRSTNKPVQIGEPVVPEPGPYDTRTGKYNNKIGKQQ